MRAYEIINEVTRINDDDTLIDAIKNQKSLEVIALFNLIKEDSDNFRIPASQIYDVKERANFVHRCILVKQDMKCMFTQYDQPMRAINEMLRYFKRK